MLYRDFTTFLHEASGSLGEYTYVPLVAFVTPINADARLLSLSACDILTTKRQFSILHRPVLESILTYVSLVAFLTPISADSRLVSFLRVTSRQSGSFQYCLGQSWRVYLLMSPCGRVLDAKKCRRSSPFAFCV